MRVWWGKKQSVVVRLMWVNMNIYFVCYKLVLVLFCLLTMFFSQNKLPCCFFLHAHIQQRSNTCHDWHQQWVTWRVHDSSGLVVGIASSSSRHTSSRFSSCGKSEIRENDTLVRREKEERGRERKRGTREGRGEWREERRGSGGGGRRKLTLL